MPRDGVGCLRLGSARALPTLHFGGTRPEPLQEKPGSSCPADVPCGMYVQTRTVSPATSLAWCQQPGGAL